MANAGRPSKFNEPLANRIMALARQGFTDAQIASAIGIAVSTLNNWKSDHPGFMEALKESKSITDELVHGALLSRALGYVHPAVKFFYDAKKGEVITKSYAEYYPPDTTACIFWLKNRRPDLWRERFEHMPVMPSQQQRLPSSFEEFCSNALYPAPFPLQCSMREFVFEDQTNTSRLLLGSRGYGKTDYTTILGTAFYIYRDRAKRVLILTKSDDKNKAIVAEISKALLANGVALERSTAHYLRAVGVHGKDHSVEALTVGSNSVRGHHPDIIIMDDPVTEEDVSEATRKKLERKYNELVKLKANIVLIGQPVHVFDLYETLRPIVKVMEVPHGTIPELDHDLVAMKLAGVSETSINASYHLKVTSETGNPLSQVSWLDKFPAGESVAFIDPSFKGGDYTAMSVGRGHFDGVAIQGFAWKKAWADCLPDIIVAAKALNIRRLGFETNSLGTQPLSVLRAAFKEAGIQVGVTGKDSTGYKHSRIMAAGTFARLIHLAKTSQRIYIDQVTKYEYGSKYDDSPDSLASLLEWLGLIKGKK